MIEFLAWIHRQRRALLTVLAVVAVAGVALACRMPAAILPDVTFPRITVLAESGERPGDEMVRAVTRPIEEALRRIPHLREVRSTTSRGSVELQLDFGWRTSMPAALQLVQAQIDAIRARLPAGTTVEARLMSPAQFPVLGLSLTSGTRSLEELRDLAVTQLKPELSRLPGVAEVVVQGGARPEARVALDPAALESRRLDAGSVANAIRRSGDLSSVGLLSANGALYLGLVDARSRSLDDLRALSIPVEGGAPVHLGELGTITLAPAPVFRRYAAGRGEAVLINLLRRESASTIQVSQGVHEWLTTHRDRLPPGVTIETFYDQSALVRNALGSVRDSLLIGAVMAMAIVFLFLRSARLGAAAAAVLPGSIGVTLFALSLLGQTLNLMTLGGVAAAVGLVLDDAIVVIEHLAHRLPPSADMNAKRRALAEIVPTLGGSSLCTLTIFIPFAFLGGVTGAFFRVLALSMSLMLASSLAICILLIPRFAQSARTREDARTRWRQPFEGLLSTVMKRPWLGMLLPGLLFAGIPLLGATLGSGFLPEMDEGALIMDYAAPPGASAEETDRLLRHVEREIRSIPEISAWSRRTGDQLGFFLTESNQGDYVLRLREHRRRSADQIADDLRSRIESTEPRLQMEFGQLVEDVVGDLTTSPEPIEVRIFGEDRRVDQQRAEQVARILESVPGVVDVKRGLVPSGPYLTIRPGAGAHRAGLDADALAERVSPYLQGIEAGEIPRGARSWPIRVVLPGPAEFAPGASIAAVRVPVPGGRWVSLGELADVRVEAGDTEITRDDGRTMVGVKARLSGRDMGSAMGEIRRRIAREVALGPGMNVTYAGLWSEQQSSFRGLAAVLAGAAAAVLLVLLVWFHSWRQAGAVLFVSVASLAGALAGLHLGGATFNIASFVGAIMVVGIVAENAFFLVAAFREELGRGASPREAATLAANRRLRPVLMTAAAGTAALAPLAFSIGAGSDLLRPLALAVIGGFVLSTPLLLAALPPILAATGRHIE